MSQERIKTGHFEASENSSGTEVTPLITSLHLFSF